MKILITGAAGFVGRHFLKALDDSSHDVYALDIRSGDGDIRDYFRTTEDRYDLVIHLAAIVGGRQTIEGQPLKVAVDLSIDAEFFQFVMRTKPKRIVYFSSSAVYPTSYQTGEEDYPRSLQEWYVDLDDIRSPDFTYGFAKLAGEYQASFLKDTGIDTFIFRPFSGYGEDQDLTYPFPSFVQRAVRRDDPFEIWGDGTAVRDFIYIDDIVQAVLTAVSEERTGTFNLGTGIATNFNQLAAMMAREVGYSPTYKHLLDKPVGVKHRVAGMWLMKDFYTPKISLEQGIRRAIRAHS